MFYFYPSVWIHRDNKQHAETIWQYIFKATKHSTDVRNIGVGDIGVG